MHLPEGTLVRGLTIVFNKRPPLLERDEWRHAKKNTYFYLGSSSCANVIQCGKAKVPRNFKWHTGKKNLLAKMIPAWGVRFFFGGYPHKGGGGQKNAREFFPPPPLGGGGAVNCQK